MFRGCLLVLSFAMLAMLPASCKSLSKLDAITGVDENGNKVALALLAVNNAPQQRPPKGSDAAKMVDMTMFALIQCSPNNGRSAQQVMRSVERLSENRNLFLDENRVLFTKLGGKDRPVQCAVRGGRLVTVPVFFDAFSRFLGIPAKKPQEAQAQVAAKNAFKLAQTMFLAIRGPYDLSGKSNSFGSTMLPRLEQAANSHMGMDATRRQRLLQMFKEGDRFFNPCHKESANTWYVKERKNSIYTCDPMKAEGSTHLADYFVGTKESSYTDIRNFLEIEIAKVHDQLIPERALRGALQDLFNVLTSTKSMQNITYGKDIGRFLAGQHKNVRVFSQKSPREFASFIPTAKRPNGLALQAPGSVEPPADLAPDLPPPADFTNNGATAPVEIMETPAEVRNFREIISSEYNGTFSYRKQKFKGLDVEGRVVTVPALEPELVTLNEAETRFNQDFTRKIAIAAKNNDMKSLAQYSAAQSALLQEATLRYQGVSKTGSDVYANDRRKAFVHDQKTVDEAYKRGDISRAQYEASRGNNVQVWTKQNDDELGEIDVLETDSRAVTMFTTSDGQLGYRYKDALGNFQTYTGDIDDEAKERGWARLDDRSLAEMTTMMAVKNRRAFAASLEAQNLELDIRDGLKTRDAVSTDKSVYKRLSYLQETAEIANTGKKAIAARQRLDAGVLGNSNEFLRYVRGSSQALDNLNGASASDMLLQEQNMINAAALQRRLAGLNDSDITMAYDKRIAEAQKAGRTEIANHGSQMIGDAKQVAAQGWERFQKSDSITAKAWNAVASSPFTSQNYQLMTKAYNAMRSTAAKQTAVANNQANP